MKCFICKSYPDEPFLKLAGHVLGPFEVDPRPLHRLPLLLLPRVDRQLFALRPRRYKGHQKLYQHFQAIIGV